MTWFRVDDKFYSHEKVLRIPRAVRPEALGTWVLCGTWSAHFERDGFVPTHMVDELGGTPAGVAALVEVGLWRTRRNGYQFVNFAEFNPTRSEKLASRRADAERQARKRARDASNEAGVSRVTDDGLTARSEPPVPSRPVPSRDDDDTPVKSHPHVGKRDARTDLSPAVSTVVENVAEHCGRHLHPLAAADVMDFIESRRGPRAEPLRNPARYYAKTIRDSAFEVQQFIDEKGLAS
jgi:hypothetical protein